MTTFGKCGGVWLLAALVASASLAGCASPPSATAAKPVESAEAKAPAGDHVASIRKAGVLRVGVLSMVPWAMPDRHGEWTGFDVDIGRQLAADLGVRVEFVRISWGGAADDVADGRVDVAAGLWPGPRRGLVVNFSDPYASTLITLVASREKASGLSKLVDFDKPGVRLGVRRGGLSENVARERLKSATLVPFDSDKAQLDALGSGEIAGLVARTPTPEFIALIDPRSFTLPLAEPMALRSEVFAIARGDADFLAYLNAWVRYREETGWLPQRRLYWLGSLAWREKL